MNFESIFQNAIDANLIVNCETGAIMEANMIASQFFQLNRNELISTIFENLFEDEDEISSREEILNVQSFQDNVSIRKHITNNGDVLSFEMLISIIEWNDSNALFVSMRNVTERKANEKKLQDAYVKLEKLSRADPLTELANRRALTESLEYEISRFGRNKENFSIILSDIDDYKQINDTFGHDAGDFVLVELAKLMTQSLRKQDVVGRWGGDEFLIILPQTNIAGGKLLGDKLRTKICERVFIFDEKIIKLSMTFGVSEYSGICSYDNCITNADKALYKAKELGKNKVITYDEL
ncbi:MAG: sensor domain-containing diguanylate cyclase [Candidatus Cloacimonetes bacterium]|nr:sensor domain-containing diguanylate cyclase [Candidatus Cloacimonadota bacterium]